MVNPFYDELGRTMRRSTPLYKPSLLLLVKRISQHYQVQFRGVTLGHRLGFCGMRQFANLALAVRWMESEIGAANAYKRPIRLTLDDVLACTSNTLPESLLVQIRRYVS